jgi:PPE-repeat protein
VTAPMDFAGMPPEVNSARMYAGAGAGSLATAAAAWEKLATELSSTAASYRAVVSELTGQPWVGPSSRAMAAAVAPYVSWMNSTAAQAQQTAGQLGSAVAAYEAAFAATVPPPAIEVNRAFLASLVSTNTFGQNTPAIAAAEAQYSEMWAQDASAMLGYAGASSAATRLSAFNSPPQTSNSTGSSNQNDTVAKAALSGTNQSVQSTLSGVPSLLQKAATGSPSGTSGTSGASSGGSLLDLFNNFSANTIGYQILSEGLNFDASGSLLTLAPPVAAAWNPLVSSLSAPAAAASSVSGSGSTLANSYGASAGLGNAGASAGLGQAASVGELSVPQSWANSPTIRLAATQFPGAGLDGLPQTGPIGPGFYGGVPPMGPVASVVNAPRGEQGRLRAGARHKVIPAAESGMHGDPAARWVEPTAPAEDDGAVSERDELNQLRRAMADVTRQRDVLKRTAATLIKEATQK